MKTEAAKNKEAVRRFNRDVIEHGLETAYDELFDPEFVNRTVAPGFDPGIAGMRAMFETVLRPALPDLEVTIHDQIAEGDRVVTRKTIRGTHRGLLFGLAPTGRPVAIEVIDIVRLRDGRYLEHWGKNDLASVVSALRASQD